MALIQFADYGPDRSPFDANFADTMENVLPLANGYGPFPAFSPISSPLPGRPMGAYLTYVANGNYKLFAGTANALYQFDGATLGWINVSKKGANQVVNGTFDADANWTKGAGVTITSGVGRLTSAPDNTSALQQSISFVGGSLYKVTFSISGYTTGGVRPIFAGGTNAVGTVRTANGTYTEYLTARSGNVAFRFGTAGTTTLDIDNVIIEPITNYTTLERWSMAQYGDWLIATNGIDPPQYIDVVSGTSFADLSPDAPKAKLVGSIGDFVMFGHLNTNQRMVQWSGLNQPQFWTPGKVSSDFQAFPDGGEVIAIAFGQQGCVIFGAESIRVGQLSLDTGMVMTFQQTITNHGCMGPRAAVATGHGVFYLSDDGFYRYDTPPVKVGDERVDKTFLEDITRQELYNVWATEDPNRKVVYFAYRSISNNLENSYDKVLLYNYGINKWSLLKPNKIMTGLVDAASPGFTLDSLSSLGIPLDQLPFSLDSRAWSGGTPTISAFDTDFRLGFFEGAPMQAVMQTGDNELASGRRSFVRGFRLLGDPPQLSGRVAVKDWAGAARTWLPEADANARTGLIPARASGRFHRFEVTIPAGTTWSAVHGVEPEGGPEGQQ